MDISRRKIRLIGVARQMEVVQQLKQHFPKLIIVGTAYSYLQDFLPNVAQAAVRLGWVDSIGLGRMVLSYPEMLSDVVEGRAFQHKLVCRTFSDCTTAPRNGLPSGCYPLDTYYKKSASAELLKIAKGTPIALRIFEARQENPGMTIKTIQERRKLNREVQGIAAALLPYETNGQVAVAAFQRHLTATHRAGLMNAVNMDTGYVNYLSDAEKLEVLGWTREALGDGVPFVAGAYIEGRDGDVVALYRQTDGCDRQSWVAYPFCFKRRGCTEKLRKKKWRRIKQRVADTRTCWALN